MLDTANNRHPRNIQQNAFAADRVCSEDDEKNIEMSTALSELFHFFIDEDLGNAFESEEEKKYENIPFYNSLRARIRERMSERKIPLS